MTEKIEFDLYVNGADEKTPQEVDQQEGQPSTTNPATPTSATGTARTAIAAQIGINAVKQTASYVTSNIGEWTGNRRLQQQVDNASRLIGYGVRIAVDPTPFKAASIASIGLELGMQAIDYTIERKWERRDYERQKARYGLGSFRNQ